MDSGDQMRRGAPSPTISPESLCLMREGISRVLSRWAALQMAIRNEWGGGDSRRKCDELASSLLSIFCRSRVLLCIDDLENALEEMMVLSFNTMVDDGSVEESMAFLQVENSRHRIFVLFDSIPSIVIDVYAYAVKRQVAEQLMNLYEECLQGNYEA